MNDDIIIKNKKYKRKTIKSCKNICLYAGILITILGIPLLLIGMFPFVIIGIVFILLSKYYSNLLNAPVNNNEEIYEPIKQQKATIHDELLKTENHRVAGVSHYEKNLLLLANKNDNFMLNKKQLVKKTLLNKNIYEYTFFPKKVELIEEPDNEYDPNAVKVLIDGQHVGYIKRGSTSHVKKILNSNNVKEITAKILGGRYKYVEGMDPYEMETDRDPYRITLSITYYV